MLKPCSCFLAEDKLRMGSLWRWFMMFNGPNKLCAEFPRIASLNGGQGGLSASKQVPSFLYPDMFIKYNKSLNVFSK